MKKATSKLPLRIGLLFVFLGLTHLANAFELVCPADVTIDCNESIYDLAQYGNAQYKDYSGWHDAGYPVVDYDLDHCDQGTITRTWTVFNPYGNVNVSCSQIIYIGGGSFTEANITWPLTGLEVSGCNPDLSPYNLPPGYQQPTWSGGQCAMIGSSYTDKVFYFSGACKKVVREWELINCCDFNVYTGEGIFRFFQEIDVTISDVPQVICPSDVTVESYDCIGSYVSVPGIEVPDTDCSDAVTIMNDSPFASSGGADASGNYPIGTTTVTFTADYGCWQKTMCQVDVTVTDNTTPTPYCRYGIAIALMGIDNDGDGVNDEGMVEVWASDLDKGSFASCGADDELIFSFSSDVTDTKRDFTCDDVGRNDVEIWVTDSQGRQNYCNTYIRVQNNAANISDCEDSDPYSTISGQLLAPYGTTPGDLKLTATAISHDGVDEIVMDYEVTETMTDSFQNATGVWLYFFDIDTVWFETTITTYPSTDYTMDYYGGHYEFIDMPHFHDYELTVEGDDPERKLINEGDLSDLKAYIAGVISLNVYQRLAADINSDGTIDQLDVDLLEAIIDGEDIEIDDTWHFYDASMDLENMEEHECEEICRIMDLKDDLNKINLRGYRLGDISGVDVAEEEIEFETIENATHEGASIQLRQAKIVESLVVSPNPFTNQLQVNLTSKAQGKATFQMKNNIGQVVLTQTLDVSIGSQNISISTETIHIPGVYLYEILLGTETFTGKLIHVK